MNENTFTTITKETLLEKFKDVMELIKAETSLQDENLREEDRKAIEGLIGEINYEYQLMNGDEDYELREARNELDDLLKEKDESLDIYESVGFKETISEGELDTLMERLVESMKESAKLGEQISDVTKERLDAPYGRYQEQTEELKGLNDKKIEMDNMSKPSVIKATKSIAELYEKSKKDFEDNIKKISDRQSELVRGQEIKRKEQFDATKEKMVKKYAEEMEKHAKLAYASQGIAREQHIRDYRTFETKYNQALGMEFKPFAKAYDELEKEKQELIEKQNQTRSKYANYLDFLGNSAVYLGIEEEFLKYKPTISAPIGEKREEQYNKADGPVVPDSDENELNANIDASLEEELNPKVEPNVSSEPDVPDEPSIQPNPSLDEPPLMLTDGREKINPDDITYHFGKDQIIQDDLTNPTGNSGNNGNGDSGNGSNSTGATESGLDAPITPTGTNGKGDNPAGPTDNPTQDDPNHSNGEDDPNKPGESDDDKPGSDEDDKGQEELPVGKLKIVFKETCQWVKDNPVKAALIAAGIVGLIIAIANIGTLTVAMSQYHAINSMLFHGSQWANAAPALQQMLHGQNLKLAADIFGAAAHFNEATGVWTIGGKSLAAAQQLLGLKIAAVSIGGALSAGVLGAGLGSLMHGKQFKAYAKRICKIKKNPPTNEEEAKNISDLRNEVLADPELSSREKDTLLKRIKKLKDNLIIEQPEQVVQKAETEEEKVEQEVEEAVDQPEVEKGNEEIMEETIGMLLSEGYSKEDIQAMIDGMLKERQTAM